jgi:predicted DNA-binding antitoxin AbrB/MazE fold protein
MDGYNGWCLAGFSEGLFAMIQRIRAIYRDGAFRPEKPCEFRENAEVELLVEETTVCAPSVSDRSERLRILRRITERMPSNPLPSAALHFSRDELLERR